MTGMGKTQLFFAVLVSSVTCASAQAQNAGNTDELKATMRVMAPGTADPEPILRKIPPHKSRKPGVDDDAPAKDLASPGGSAGHGDSGADPGVVTAPDPVVPDSAPIAPDPVPTPLPDPIIPAAPDPRDAPGDFGHGAADDARNHGEDARRHSDPKPDKPRNDPPRGPATKPPPAPRPPDQRPPDRRPPDRRPPEPRPRDPRPPDHRPPEHSPPGQPRERPPAPPDGPRRPRR
jgi:hypothetical protein